MTFSSKRVRPLHPDLFYNGNNITEVSSHTHLGITLSSNLTWRAHIVSIYQKASKRLNMLKGIRYKVGRDTLRKLYKSLSDLLWSMLMCFGTAVLMRKANSLNRFSMKPGKSSQVLCGEQVGFAFMTELGWEEMKVRRDIHKLICYFKIVKNLSPSYLKDLLPARVCERTHYNLRSSQNFTLFPVCTERFKRSFFPSTLNCGTTLIWKFMNLIQLALLRER